MQAELSDGVASGAFQPLSVLQLLAMGAEGRHRVRANREVIRPWLQTLPPSLADEAVVALDLGEQAESLGPAVPVVRVSTEDASVDKTPLKVTPRRAANLLSRPFHVVLENGANDGDFLLAFARNDERVPLEAALNEGWLEYWNGGGIAGCLARAEQLQGSAAICARTFVMVDSDARSPGQEDEAAGKVRAALKAAAGDWTSLGHVLKRRAIENYVPAEAFASWWAKGHLTAAAEADAREWLRDADETAMAGLAGDHHQRVWICAMVYATVDDKVRDHYDVSLGRGSSGNLRTDDAIWNQLTPWQQEALKHGLGKKNVRAFYKKARNLGETAPEVADIVRRILRSL